MKKIKLILISFSALLISCHSEPLPEGILNQKAMTELLTDVYLLEGAYTNYTKDQLDSATNQIKIDYDSLFHKHKITPEQFETNLTYYAEHATEYDTINQRVLRNIKAYGKKNNTAIDTNTMKATIAD